MNAGYKLLTNFAFFKFNSTIQEGVLRMEWCAVDNEGDGRLFTYDELELFQKYATSRLDNFPGNNKDYKTCGEEENTPYCGIETLRDDDKYPTTFIIRKKPSLSKFPNSCVDVILTDKNGTDKHDYNLPFDVIGQII